MKYKFKIIPFLFLTVFFLQSCKKDFNIFEKEPETTLPNFGNIKLKDVFDREDNRLENKDSITTIISQYYHSIWEGGELWGGFLVAKGDKILFENYRGYAQDSAREPIDKKTPLHIASISKPLTAVAILKLVEAGRLNLDDDIAQFFPNFPYKNITVKQLLNHRSGLPKYEHFIEKIKPQPEELSKKFLTNQDILNLIVRYKPKADRLPDTGFIYCNTNYALLALIVEKITKFPFPEAMQQMVFRPLKMKNTFIFQEKDTLSAPKSFYAKGPKVYPYDRLDLIYGDKNVFTTPRDLFNFSRAMHSEDFLREDIMNQVFIPYSNEKSGINNYGLGFRMKVFDNGEKLTYHTGWWHGSNGVFAHLKKSGVTIVALGNKFSRRVYTALTLSALFEDFPYETDELRKALKTADSLNLTTKKDEILAN